MVCDSHAALQEPGIPAQALSCLQADAGLSGVTSQPSPSPYSRRRASRQAGGWAHARYSESGAAAAPFPADSTRKSLAWLDTRRRGYDDYGRFSDAVQLASSRRRPRPVQVSVLAPLTNTICRSFNGLPWIEVLRNTVLDGSRPSPIGAKIRGCSLFFRSPFFGGETASPARRRKSKWAAASLRQEPRGR